MHTPERTLIVFQNCPCISTHNKRDTIAHMKFNRILHKSTCMKTILYLTILLLVSRALLFFWLKIYCFISWLLHSLVPRALFYQLLRPDNSTFIRKPNKIKFDLFHCNSFHIAYKIIIIEIIKVLDLTKNLTISTGKVEFSWSKIISNNDRKWFCICIHAR